MSPTQEALSDVCSYLEHKRYMEGRAQVLAWSSGYCADSLRCERDRYTFGSRADCWDAKEMRDLYGRALAIVAERRMERR